MADTAWAILGPYSLVKLSKVTAGTDASALAWAVGAALWSWARDHAAASPGFRLQLDEPALGLAMTDADRALRDAAYEGAGAIGLDEPPTVTVQFGAASEETLGALGASGLRRPGAARPSRRPREDQRAGARSRRTSSRVMDGRSVWPDDFAAARSVLQQLPGDGKPISIVPSASLMFLPDSVEGEELPPASSSRAEKAARARALARGTARPADRPPVQRRRGRSGRRSAS